LSIGGPNLKEISTESATSFPKIFQAFYINGLSNTATLDVSKVLSKIPNLIEFSLKDAGIATLDFTWPFMNSLRYMFLRSCDVENFINLDQSYLPKNLIQLDIQYTSTRKLPNQFLNTFSNLQMLWLLNNELESLQITGLKKLQFLSISQNNFKNGIILRDLPGLEYVTAGFSGIIEIPVSKKETPNVRQADFVYNDIRHVDARLMPDVQFRILSLTGNEFYCDCEDLGHVRFVEQNRGNISELVIAGYEHDCGNSEFGVMDVDFSECEGFETTSSMTSSVVPDENTTDDMITTPKQETTESSSFVLNSSIILIVSVIFA